VSISRLVASGAVARRFEIEFVGDRLAGARLAQAYSVLAPERRRVTGNGGSIDERHSHADGRADEGGGDLRLGVLGASAPRADDSQSDRRAA
jgi:hypothetical protein